MIRTQLCATILWVGLWPELSSAQPQPADSTGGYSTETVQLEGDATDSAEFEDDNLTEAIDLGPTSAPAVPSSPAPTQPATTERFTLHGWARQSAELGFSRDVYYEAEPDPLAVSYEPLALRTQLFLRARYSRSDWFEANVSGLVAYGFFEQTPSRASTVFNGFNGQARRGELSTLLHEAFVAFYSTRFDVRFGQQRVSWGRGDFISPNDIINPRDARDPLLAEAELRVQPSLQLRADLDLGFGSLQAIWTPVFIPDRFDVYGSNWAALQPGAPPGLRGFVNLLQRSTDPSVRNAVQQLLGATQLPAADLTQPAAGARFTWSAGGVDVGHYYHYGFDGPWLSIAPDLAMTLANTDFARVGLADFQPFLRAIDRGERPLRASYVRRHHVGLDVSTIAGPFAIRFDGAFQSRRVFYRSDIQSVISPALSGVLSLEYQHEDAELLILLEAIYVRVLDSLRTPLLFYERDTIGGALLWRWQFWSPFGLELRTMMSAQPRMAIVVPQLTLKFDALLLAVGGVWIGGEERSFGGYFRRNRELFIKAKYFF